MARLLAALCLLTLACAAAAEPLYCLGPMSDLSRDPEGHLYNGFFDTIVERGFKLQAYEPAFREPGLFGTPRYAGFFTLLQDGQPFFPRFAQSGDGTQVRARDAWHARVSKVFGEWSQTLETWLGYPLVWLEATVPADQPTVTWSITGFSWVGQTTPDRLGILDPASRSLTYSEPLAGEARQAEVPLPLAGPLLSLSRPADSYQLVLILAAQPSRIEWTADSVNLTFPVTGGQAPVMAVAILPAAMPGPELAQLVPLALARPTRRDMTFATTEGAPSVTLSGEFASLPSAWGIAARPALPYPPSLSSLAPDRAWYMPTLHGEVAFVPAAQVTVPLPPVESLDQALPPAGVMDPPMQERLNRLAAELCNRLRYQGGFTSSLGRPFYDGLTCSGLMTAYPYLTPELQARVAEAVGRTLTLWWRNLRLDGEVGIWYFPEPVPMLPVVDYPEITGTLLWPTVLYARLVDPGFPARFSVGLHNLASTLPLAYDWNGAAFAHAGPGLNHLITESVIGGFVTWVAIHQLADMAGDPALSAEATARAALASRSMNLLRWLPPYGEEGIVNELQPDRVKTSLHDAWCYTMYTWFANVPAFTLPADDIYGVWRNLEAAQWWDYSTQSHQRCYDYAHLIAVARFRSVPEALDRLAVLDDRPYAYDSFDPTPAYTLMAYPWLAGLTAPAQP